MIRELTFYNQNFPVNFLLSVNDEKKEIKQASWNYLTIDLTFLVSFDIRNKKRQKCILKLTTTINIRDTVPPDIQQFAKTGAHSFKASVNNKWKLGAKSERRCRNSSLRDTFRVSTIKTIYLSTSICLRIVDIQSKGFSFMSFN